MDIGCVNLIFALKQVMEKVLQRKKKVYATCIDLEKVYVQLIGKHNWKF